ncbi:MAG: YcjF family protein [Coriobacteriia bacterium]
MALPRLGTALPFDVRDVTKSGTRYTEERELPVRIGVYVEVDAPDALIDAIRDSLRPRTARAVLQIEVAELGATPPLQQLTDVVVVVAGTGNVGLRQAVTSVRQQRIPIVAVGLGDGVRDRELADALGQPTGDVIVSYDPAEVISSLGAWLSDALASKRLALAHNFAFMRRAVAEDAVRTTAWQNALVGAVTPIAGADMPIMTANQAKMLLQIAAAYGEPLGKERIKELLAIVGGGYLMRAVARQALTLVPVLGWAVKGGIGYTGTLAMGKAAVQYFEEGNDLGQVLANFRGMIASTAAKRPRRGRKTVAELPVVEPPAFDDGGQRAE